MARLPTVGGDDGNWGTVLNEFLESQHNTDGTHPHGTGGLTSSTISPTTENVNATINTRYFIDGSGLTADRNLVMPSCSVGDEIELKLTDEGSYKLNIIGDSGVSIESGTAATTWYWLLLTGENVRFVCNTDNNWSVVSDGRYPRTVRAKLSTAQSVISTGNGTLINWDTVNSDVDDTITTGVDWKFTAPADIEASFNARVALQDGGEFFIEFFINGSRVDAFEYQVPSSSSWNSGLAAAKISLNAGDYVQVYARKASGSSNTRNYWMTLDISFFFRVTGELESPEDPAYYMALHNPDDKNLWLMGSPDGLNFTHISESELYVAENMQRDPTMVYHNSKWWICYTNETEHNFSIISSSNLTDWEFVTNVDFSSIANVHYVWAPSWFIDTDDSVHAFAAVSTNGVTTNFQIYRVSASNADLTSWSSPTAVTITGKGNVIDPHLILKSGTYYMWYKQENADYIEIASSSTLTGTYTPIKEGNWAGWGTPVENPSLYQLDNGDWRIIFQQHDGFDPTHEWYSDSSDDWETWTARAELGYCNYIPGGPSVLKRTW